MARRTHKRQVSIIIQNIPLASSSSAIDFQVDGTNATLTRSSAAPAHKPPNPVFPLTLATAGLPLPNREANAVFPWYYCLHRRPSVPHTRVRPQLDATCYVYDIACAMTR